MAGEWRTTRLGNHISLKGGLSYKGIHIDKGNALLVGMGCVSHSERFLSNGARRYGGEFSESHRLRPGDLVIATRQQSDDLPILGYPAMIPDALEGRDVVVATNLYKITNSSEIDNRFLYWLLRGKEYRERILKCSKGTTVRMLTKDAIEDFEFLCPPAQERDRISSILDSLDDKIELNRRMNETLEAMTQTIFKSWFVDFEPFSDQGMQDSPLGEIPKGWKVDRLDKVLVLQRGFDLPTVQRTPGLYPVIAASGPSGTHNQFMVRGPGVTTGRSGVLGNVFYVHEDFWPLNTSLWVKEFKHSRPAFAFHLLQRLDLGVFNAGSAVPTLNRNHIHGLPIAIPPMELIEAFESAVVPLLTHQKTNDEESRTLAALRDALLPKFISGEIRVEDAERVAKTVGIV